MKHYYAGFCRNRLRAKAASAAARDPAPEGRSYLPAFMRSRMKTGPPTSAVMTPTGISAG